MKKLLLILLCLPMIGLGQGWTHPYGGIDGDEGNSVQQTTDGGYIITGFTTSSGNGDWDVYLIKTDDNGNQQWDQTFGGTDSDYGRSVQQTTDGGYIITGSTGSFGNGFYDVYLIKTDDNGNSLWTKTFGGTGEDSGNSVEQTNDGGYIITGFTENFGSGGVYDVYLIKTDGSGNQQWSQTYGGTSHDFGWSVQQTTDGGYIICGHTSSFGNGGSDIYLIKTNSLGDSLWTKTYGGTYTDYGRSVEQTTDGGYIITGFTQNFVSGNAEVYLIKTDGSGNQQWGQTFGGNDSYDGYSVQQTTDGGYIITGWILYLIGGNPVDQDVYLIKTDSQGNTLWTKTFDSGNGEDEGHCVQQTSDGGYIITGSLTSSSGLDLDVWLIKTDGNGNVTSTIEIPLSNPNRKSEKIVDLLGRETKGKKNEPLFYIYDDGTVEKRIVIE